MGFESLIPGLIGGIGAMFGGGTDAEMTDEQRRLWKQWQNFIGSERRYARSAPLSTTLEQQGLANSSALLSNAQQRNMQGLFGQMAPTALGNPSTADALKNVAQANTAQQGSLYADALQNSLQDRRNAKMRIPSYLQGAAGIANNPGVPAQPGGMDSLLPLLFKFGQQWGQRGTSGGGGGNTVNGQAVDPQGNALNQSPSMGGGSLPIGQWGQTGLMPETRSGQGFDPFNNLRPY